MDADQVKKLFGIPCGCDNRKEIMGSGNWQMDAIIVGSVSLLILGIILFKYTDVLSLGSKAAE